MSDPTYTHEEIKEYLRDINSAVESGKYNANQLFVDFCKTINIAKQLQQENKRLREIFKKCHGLAESLYCQTIPKKPGITNEHVTANDLLNLIREALEGG